MQNNRQGYPTGGLTREEVADRRVRGLVNQAPDAKTKSIWDIIRDNVCTLFNLLNVLIGVALALVGAWANMLFFGVIFFNCVIGIFQQWHAKKLVEKLSLLSPSKVNVLRDGEPTPIPVDELVMDDVFILEMGSQICADAQVLHGEIEANEALLTGEADPIVKKPGDHLLSGSFVISGRCCAQVEHVGADNFVNQLSQGAKKHRKVKSELIRAMGKVTKFTGYFILPVGVLLLVQALFFRGDSAFLSVVSTAAALLGMLPKGLILLISISTAVGVIALSKRRVLVQDLYCIESLAHVDVLCLDKTGTITQGHMQVQEVLWLEQPEVPSAQKALESYLAVCEDNNATMLALKDHFTPECSWDATGQTAFSSQRKWGSVTFGHRATFVLGAPEMLIPNVSALPESMKAGIKDGDRVLCFGFANRPPDGDVSPAIKPLAFLRISDPVRQEATQTLAFFKREGVDIKVISGDHPVTVSAVARKAGVEGYERYIDLSTLKTDGTCQEKRTPKIEVIYGKLAPSAKKERRTETAVCAPCPPGVNTGGCVCHTTPKRRSRFAILAPEADPRGRGAH